MVEFGEPPLVGADGVCMGADWGCPVIKREVKPGIGEERTDHSPRSRSTSHSPYRLTNILVPRRDRAIRRGRSPRGRSRWSKPVISRSPSFRPVAILAWESSPLESEPTNVVCDRKCAIERVPRLKIPERPRHDPPVTIDSVMNIDRKSCAIEQNSAAAEFSDLDEGGDRVTAGATRNAGGMEPKCDATASSVANRGYS